MILLSHPTGNAAVRHAALGLHRAGLLGEFWTGLHLPIPNWANRWLPNGLSQDLQRRSFPEELRKKIRSHPWREATRLLAGRFGLGGLTHPNGGSCSLDAVHHSLDRQVARRLSESRFTGVYAYEQGAEHAFRTAREFNQLAIYEQTTGHWKSLQRVLDQEAQEQPEWAATLGARPEASALTERLDAELGLAHVVIVPTTFIKRTLEQSSVMRARVAVIPHGISPPVPSGALPERSPFHEHGRLRVLYVGALSQRKGIRYLFDAMTALGGSAELTLASRRANSGCAALDQHVSRCRQVAVHCQADVMRQMLRHDVLVCPSLFDPTSPEIALALAVGLPVIATPHTSGPDYITDGVEGFIVPVRSATALAEKLTLLHEQPDRLAEMGRAGKVRAADTPWQRYEQTVATRVNEGMALAGHGTSASFSPPLPIPPLPGVFPRERA